MLNSTTGVDQSVSSVAAPASAVRHVVGLHGTLLAIFALCLSATTTNVTGDAHPVHAASGTSSELPAAGDETGACCLLYDGRCVNNLTEAECIAAGECGGLFIGVGTTCDDVDQCPIAACPICNQPEENCQARADGTNLLSDELAESKIDGVQTADDFVPAQSATIESLCWHGIELLFDNGFSICPINHGQEGQFRVRYLEDDDGVPGDPIAEFTGQPDFARISFVAFPFGDAGVIEYSLDHDPVAVNAGTCYWVEIVRLTSEGECWFYWSPSAEGNGVAFQTDFDTPYDAVDDLLDGFEHPDRAFCLDLALDEPGICPDIECPGDITSAGEVNVDDLLLLLNNWGACADCNACPADLTDDCEIDVDDLLLILNNWGPC